MQHDAFGGLIAQVRLRLLIEQTLISACAGAACFALLSFLRVHHLWAAVPAAAVSVASLRLLRGRTSASAAAQLVERASSGCQNLAITAEELERHPDRASSWIAMRVRAAAVRAIAGIEPSDVVPVRRLIAPVAMFAGLLVASLSTPSRSADRAADNAVGRHETSASAAQLNIEVAVQPPAYSPLPSERLANPPQLDVLEGTRLTFHAPAHQVRFGDAILAADQAIVASTDGFFVAEAPDGRDRRLIPLRVRPDRPPSVRIENPGRDLLLGDARRTLPVSIAASDDLGLARLELLYTKISGSGEQFEFTGGSIPVTIERRTAVEWRAAAELRLDALDLGPGDSLVYQAASTDRRPGRAGTSMSETYFVEILGPGQIALEGADMPPELERYALSQQMIVVKIERLRAREQSISREELSEATAGLAAEQRTVRANFIFLLGGHVEDEEVEAEQSHEIQEGRLENTARRDINAAVGHMTRAEQGLSAVDAAAALPPARAAVAALQRAFGRNRFLLRTLTARSRVDPARRLSGDLAGSIDWRRAPGTPVPRSSIAIERLLDRLMRLSGTLRTATAASLDRELASLAEAALSVDPSSPRWLDIARRLESVRQSALRDPNRAAGGLDDVIRVVTAEAARVSLVRTPAFSTDPVRRAFEQGRRR